MDAAHDDPEVGGLSRVSDRKARANAENARRSTGPHTASGKHKSSMNALKHGGFATAAVAIPRGAFAEDPRARRVHQRHHRCAGSSGCARVRAGTTDRDVLRSFATPEPLLSRGARPPVTVQPRRPRRRRLSRGEARGRAGISKVVRHRLRRRCQLRTGGAVLRHGAQVLRGP